MNRLINGPQKGSPKGIADYEFIERLGTGNHGTFWTARRPLRLQASTPHERVGVKVLAHHATEQDFKRMANELQIYAAVSSPHLVPILDAGQQDGTLYYATEFFENGSLGSSARPLDSATIVQCIADAALAAHALHEAGIAHRDIKPDNIMVSNDNRGVLADLGLAQILTPGQTMTGVGPVGTIEYLAPELVRGETAGRPTDIWALGATIHRSLTGRSLYQDLPANALLDALRYLLRTEPQLDSSLSGEVRAVVERCLAPDPSARYPTAEALSHDLSSAALR